ncbi:MAG TPA: hypothetical protein DD666_11210 [Advenella kashmirensis]|uniref:Uncharacterized protein n=1 Tax=Advenella kashmirensis TaxID=310575 RepID=A0A356LHA5_9BURK|nr:hypothetical protein [Advenella kashmirensis]
MRTGVEFFMAAPVVGHKHLRNAPCTPVGNLVCSADLGYARITHTTWRMAHGQPTKAQTVRRQAGTGSQRNVSVVPCAALIH